MPKKYTLRSLCVNDNILYISTSTYQTSERAIERLSYDIGGKIGKTLKLDSDGVFQLQESEIPECYTVDETPIPIESAESSTMSNSTQTTLELEGNVDSGKNKEQEGYFMAEEVPDGKGPPASLGSTVRDRGLSLGREVRHGSSSSQPHANAENSSPTTSVSGDAFTPGTSVVSDTDSNTTATPKISDEKEPSWDPIGQRVRAEIKLAATGFLKCFTEHVEGMPY